MLEFEMEFLLCISTSGAVGEPSGCTSFSRLLSISRMEFLLCKSNNGDTL